MQFDLRSILLAMRATVVDPRAGARAVMALNLPVTVGAMALLLMVIVSSLLSQVAVQIFAAGGDGLAGILNNPLQMVMIQLIVLAITAILIVWVGQRFGGRGSLAQAVSLLAWLEAMLNLLQAVQLLLMFVAPGAAEMLGFVSILLFLWLLAHFVAEMHGFPSPLRVLLMIMVVGFAFSFVIAFLGAMLFGMGSASV